MPETAPMWRSEHWREGPSGCHSALQHRQQRKKYLACVDGVGERHRRNVGAAAELLELALRSPDLDVAQIDDHDASAERGREQRAGVRLHPEIVPGHIACPGLVRPAAANL